MMEYKNKPYDKNWTISQFIDKLIQYYNYYTEDLCQLKSAIIGQSIEFDIEKDLVDLDDIETIMTIDEIYNLFIPIGDDD